MKDALPRVLLVEPQFVLRRTLAAVARDMQLADVQEAASFGAAERLAGLQRYDVVVLASDAASDSGAALATLAATAGAGRALLLLAPGHPEPVTPHPVLRKPVNVKALLQLLARTPAMPRAHEQPASGLAKAGLADPCAPSGRPRVREV